MGNSKKFEVDKDGTMSEERGVTLRIHSNGKISYEPFGNATPLEIWGLVELGRVITAEDMRDGIVAIPKEGMTEVLDASTSGQ